MGMTVISFTLDIILNITVLTRHQQGPSSNHYNANGFMSDVCARSRKPTQQTSQLLSVEVYKKAGMHGVGQCKKGKEGFFCPESGKPVLQDGSRNA